MLAQHTKYRKLCIILFIALFFINYSFAQGMIPGSGDEEEISSWVLDFSGSGSNQNQVASTNPEFHEWNIGAAMGYEEPSPAPAPSSGGGGSTHGGRLGTANYSLQNRSKLATLGRQAAAAIAAKEAEHAAAPLEEIAPEHSDHFDPVDDFLVAEAGNSELVTPYEAPVMQKQEEVVVQKKPVAVTTTKKVQKNISVPHKTTSSQPHISRPQSYEAERIIITPNKWMNVQPTHLMSWDGIEEDIRTYKYDVIRKQILHTIIIIGKTLFYVGVLGILLALFFRKELSIYRHRSARQLTLFSLLK